jgi:8-oxo-dGTP diphosphatase
MECFEERRPELYGKAVHHVFKVLGWVGGEPTNICDEHSEIRWFDVEELSQLPNLVDCDYPKLVKLATG